MLNARGQRAPNDVRLFRSTDVGKSWSPGGEFPKRSPGDLKPYLFGSIVRGLDETLRTIVYSVDESLQNIESAWMMTSRVAGYHQHPPHLLRLEDQRLLLTYGNRRDGSIEARLGENNAKAWGAPHKLYTTGLGDMGYPSHAGKPTTPPKSLRPISVNCVRRRARWARHWGYRRSWLPSHRKKGPCS